MNVTACRDCFETIILDKSGAWFTQGGSDTPYRCESGRYPYHVPSGKTPPKMNYKPNWRNHMPSQEFKENLKAQIETNPAWVIGASAGLLAALAKLWEAKTDAKRARAYEKNVRRLERKDRKGK